jgi:hypothetical protein
MTDNDALPSLLGIWELVSLVARLPDGSIVEPWGKRPPGRIAYGEGGQMMALIVSDRGGDAGGQPGDPLARGEFAAYFGTYEIDAHSRTVVHHIASSLAGRPASPELRRQYEFADGNLVLTFPWNFEGKPVENRLVWKRMVAP